MTESWVLVYCLSGLVSVLAQLNAVKYIVVYRCQEGIGGEYPGGFKKLVVGFIVRGLVVKLYD